MSWNPTLTVPEQTRFYYHLHSIFIAHLHPKMVTKIHERSVWKLDTGSPKMAPRTHGRGHLLCWAPPSASSKQNLYDHSVYTARKGRDLEIAGLLRHFPTPLIWWSITITSHQQQRPSHPLDYRISHHLLTAFFHALPLLYFFFYTYHQVSVHLLTFFSILLSYCV